ncbi:MAG: hypothetical protein L0241_23270 [Planctomycetia bacterium]|nr:hypothetical protein [Planctomycetia bacterium]
MTETEWLTSNNPPEMLHYLPNNLFNRKLRLVACGCCRMVWDLLTDNRSRIAIRKLEASADDLDNGQLRVDAYNTANAPFQEMSRGQHDPQNPELLAAHAVVYATYLHPGLYHSVEDALIALRGLDRPAVQRLECDLLRDIFGNPFRTATFSPEWRTDTALSLARQMYESREFSAMPILADALQDAGCDNEDILSHCRDANQVHARGCWVVDLVLGKE